MNLIAFSKNRQLAACINMKRGAQASRNDDLTFA